MVCAGMFFTAVCALLISVGAQSILDLDCAYEETSDEFCEYVMDAYEANSEAMRVLKPRKTFVEDKKKLREANRLIGVLLEKTELADLLAALKEALSAELDAAVKLEAHCSEEGLEKILKTRCEEARDNVGDAIEELVHAVTVLPLVKNSTLAVQADKAYPQFGGFYQGELRTKYSDAALILGSTVLEAFSNQNEAVEAPSN